MSKYFIIIDMQNDFTTGALKNDAATKMIPAIVEKAKELKAKGYTIIATRDTHQENYLETQEGKNLPVPHCIENSDGWQVVEPIAAVTDKYVNKPSFGFAGWKEFFEKSMNDSNVEDIQMCGTCTGICVASNYAAIKAAFPELAITVYKNLCACVTPESHAAAITTMQMQHAVIK